MARKANYEGKIQVLEKKIEKKEEEIKGLKATLAEWKAKKAKDDYADLIEYMKEKKMSAAEVLEKIK